jgi:hypothetical protein
VDREVRQGLNESWFREVNERLEQRADAQGRAETFHVLCECKREDCGERITITFADYEHVRADPRAFVVLTTHVDTEVEQVVSTRDDYVVVHKFGEAGLVAEIENPRDG